MIHIDRSIGMNWGHPGDHKIVSDLFCFNVEGGAGNCGILKLWINKQNNTFKFEVKKKKKKKDFSKMQKTTTE